MITAVRRGHLEVVRSLVECGADKNNHDSNGITPLLEAIKRNNLDIVKVLVEARADIEFVDAYGATPLNCAARKGTNIRIVHTTLSYYYLPTSLAITYYIINNNILSHLWVDLK